MKKVVKSIVLAMFIFMISITGVSAKELDVSITKVDCSNMNNGVVKDKLKAEIKDLAITVEDSKFSKVGDYTKCELEITNQSKDEIVVDTASISNLSNDFVNYNLTSADNNTKITSGKTKTYQLTIDYKKEYDKDTVLDNVVELKLHGKNNTLINPQTASTLFILSGIVLIAIIVTLVVLLTNDKTRNKIVSLIVLGILITIPTVQALTNVTISLKNKIIIEVPGYHVYYKVMYGGTHIPEHELKNYDLNQTECDYENYGLIEGDETNTKYYYCDEPIIYGGKYKEGIQVELQSQEVYYFNDCEEKEGYWLCRNPLKENITYWDYEVRYNPTYKATDKDIMNFMNGLSYDGWDKYEEFRVEVPNTFTMPDHDVFFTVYSPFAPR